MLHRSQVRVHLLGVLTSLGWDDISHMITEMEFMISCLRPSSLKNLSLVDGFSHTVINRVGQRFIDTIREFCNEHKFNTDAGLDYLSFTSIEGKEVSLTLL